jgi:hypothetical protein
MTPLNAPPPRNDHTTPLRSPFDDVHVVKELKRDGFTTCTSSKS